MTNTKRALVAEHDSAGLMCDPVVLKDRGYEVDVTEKLGEALELIAKNHYDFVIADINLNKRGAKDIEPGLAIHNKLRSRTDSKDSRLVFISGNDYNLPLFTEKFSSDPHSEYLGKPYSIAKLLPK